QRIARVGSHIRIVHHVPANAEVWPRIATLSCAFPPEMIQGFNTVLLQVYVGGDVPTGIEQTAVLNFIQGVNKIYGLFHPAKSLGRWKWAAFRVARHVELAPSRCMPTPSAVNIVAANTIELRGDMGFTLLCERPCSATAKT